MKSWLARLLIAITAASTLMTSAAGAQGERIIKFESAVRVSRQSVASITETIVYDFGAASRHGIFRTIPVEYQPHAGTVYYLKFNLVGVTDANGRGLPVKEESAGGTAVLRIGDPDKTVSGQQTYRIAYELSPIIYKREDRGHLALNLVGDRWEVPIAEAAASLEFETEPSGYECYAGKLGSADTSGCAKALDGNTVRLRSMQPLAPGEDITVEAYLPTEYTTNYLQANVRPPRSWGEIVVIAAVVLAGVSAVILVDIVLVGRWLRKRRRRKSQTIVAQYEPPAGLSPAQMGILHDDSGSMVEITATLIDLAVRGYLRIEQTKPKSWMSAAKYRLTRLKTPDVKLAAYESKLLKALFGDKDAVDLGDVDKTKMAEAISSIHSDLKESLKAKGFYGRWGTEPGIVEKAFDAGNISDAGAKKWAEVKGFELYLTVAEKDRLKFTDAPEKTPKLFSTLLPYAVALGVERDWAKQFAGLDLANETDWYVGPSGTHFGAVALVGNLSSSFSSTIASLFTAPSSGGGGGSVGGGFGGGGGGSW